MTIYEQKIEALLFYKNEPIMYCFIAKVLKIKEDEVKSILSNMKSHYEGRGIILVMTEDSVALMTSSIATPMISELLQSKEEKKLSKQALETLAIILYKKQVIKAEIDYIRGVNSIFILRNLLMRGLITKKTNFLDKHSFLYLPTQDTLSYLGIDSVESLPDFELIQNNLNKVEDQFNNEQIKKESLVVGDTIAQENNHD